MEEESHMISTAISKPFWFFVRYRKDIKLVNDENNILNKKFNEVYSLIEFDTLEGAQNYFNEINELIEKGVLETKIIYSYEGKNK